MASSEQPANSPVRRTVYFSGRVQGVGFRYTVQTLALDFAVTGRVRNLADGRVELVAEAMPDELDRFVAAVGQSMANYIARTEVSQSPPTGEYTDFQVAF